MYDVFSLPSIAFPKGFLWGSATAGHQVEGDNIYSQRWQLEQQGKFDEPSGRACKHYQLYTSDVDLIRSLGHQVYRFSVEWSRVEPVEGQFNEDALYHYEDLTEKLKQAGIQSFVTLHHFTHPLWFENMGGFCKMENLRYFEKNLKQR